MTRRRRLRAAAARSWGRRRLRTRLTVLATAVVAGGLVVGAVLSVRVLGSVLVRTVDDAARQQASTVAELVRNGRVPDPLPVTGSTAGVQVLDSRGRVLAASAGGDRLAPLLTGDQLDAARAGGAVTLPGSRIGLDGPLRVLGRAADVSAAPGGRRTVLVAVSVVDLARSTGLLAVAAGIGVPLLVGLFALLCWSVLGSALRPVTALRAGAEQITAAGSARRLPVPVADDEIASLARTLNRMLDRLAASAATQRTFVADAAHELRNPLAAVRTAVEVDLAHPAAADPVGTGHAVLADLDRLDRLVADLLLLARVDEAGPRAVARREVLDLAALVAGAVRARDRRSRVPVRLARAVPAPVAGDAAGLRRVVDNLLDNAVHHAAGAVRASVSVDGPWVLLCVVDDGPGIPPGDRERVFDRFTRLDPARARDAGGSGLGLAIVGATVAAHGGRVALRDAGPGLRAEVRLPHARGRLANTPGGRGVSGAVQPTGDAEPAAGGVAAGDGGRGDDGPAPEGPATAGPGFPTSDGDARAEHDERVRQFVAMRRQEAADEEAADEAWAWGIREDLRTVSDATGEPDGA